ncbi:hypothetical protein E4T39_01183 [Aureobasidium subglaciale]|nr:hypothetical protein E4T39_01183 [Aureobasidium subglaciale]
MPSTIAACKFVGTTSLGLFTGVSYSLAALSIPSLLALPSAKPAQHVFVSLKQSASLHLRSLAVVSFLTFNLAYLLSPARARHPYLLWTALVAGLAGASDLIPAQSLIREQDDVNGETVEKAVKASQRIEQARATVGLAGFAMAVIGIWGDGA